MDPHRPVAGFCTRVRVGPLPSLGVGARDSPAARADTPDETASVQRRQRDLRRWLRVRKHQRLEQHTPLEANGYCDEGGAASGGGSLTSIFHPGGLIGIRRCSRASRPAS